MELVGFPLGLLPPSRPTTTWTSCDWTEAWEEYLRTRMTTPLTVVYYRHRIEIVSVAGNNLLNGIDFSCEPATASVFCGAWLLFVPVRELLFRECTVIEPSEKIHRNQFRNLEITGNQLEIRGNVEIWEITWKSGNRLKSRGNSEISRNRF